MAAQVGILAGQRLQYLAHGLARELHRILLAGILAERSGNQNLSHRSILPWELPSGQSPAGSYWHGRSARSLSIVRRRRTRSRSWPDRAWKNTHRNWGGSETRPKRPSLAHALPGRRDSNLSD